MILCASDLPAYVSPKIRILDRDYKLGITAYAETVSESP
jgi:hypothetical protein